MTILQLLKYSELFPRAKIISMNTKTGEVHIEFFERQPVPVVEQIEDAVKRPVRKLSNEQKLRVMLNSSPLSNSEIDKLVK